jgi:hypothetical protein
VERLIAATPLRGSNGITFGPDGRLWVAEYLPGRISAVDVSTGHVEVIVGPDGPLQSPDDLVFDADGNLYITDVAPGRVWRRSPSGELTVAADGIHNPNGIAAVGNRIFVNEMIPGGRVLELPSSPPAADPPPAADSPSAAGSPFAADAPSAAASPFAADSPPAAGSPFAADSPPAAASPFAADSPPAAGSPFAADSPPAAH